VGIGHRYHSLVTPLIWCAVWCIKRGFNVAQVGEAVGIGHHATALVAIANDDRSWPGRTLTSF
jgi:hypothetical protein